MTVNIQLYKKEPNADATRFFDLLKDFHELLWDGYTNHIKLSCCFYKRKA
jgi:hypothetical protein